MRIQHNIMAMNAYRNYTNNVSAMKSNLEKLSSGYKINRAGDDAAGLAISEKMRAQITGLQTAQKNAKDGISLVQTAEGAMTEVHDMLNRMVELASMSANGTYDNTTDRTQLQKEVNQLVDEINRIADSSNFNGIKLLDGSMSSDAAKITGDARIISEVYTSGNAAALSGTKTFLDGEVPSEEVKTVFEMDFTGLTKAKDGDGTPAVAAAAATKAKYNSGEVTALTANGKLTIGGFESDIDVGTQDTLTAQLAKFVQDYNADTNNEYVAAANADGKSIDFEAKTAGKVGGDTADAPTAAPAGTTQVTEGKDAVDAADAVGDPDGVGFTLTIAGKEFTLDPDGAVLKDGDDAGKIAEAAFKALGGTTAGTDVDVEINGINYTVNYAAAGDKKITFTLKDTVTEKNVSANYDWDIKGNGNDSFDGNHTAGVKVTTPGKVYKDAPLANTVFKLEANDIKDGTKITIDGTTVTLSVGKNSQFKNASNVVDLTWMEEDSVDLNQAISTISKGFAGDTTNFIVGVNDTSNKDTHPGLTVHKKETSTETYDTKAKLAAVFEIEKPAGGGMTLQIGDTADTYNQLKVSIKDMHAASLGISGVDISTQEGAADAITKIKDAINTVSDVRGTLGATQNRLDHTINNLGVMTENIQDAESTIRDTDVAEEMMAYTKNNILIQSAQAMLAQANQVPQGVLQLLG